MRHTAFVSGRADAFVIPVRTVRRLVGLLVVALLLAAAVVLWQQRSRVFGADVSLRIDEGAYQAVVLVTNQAYFGKLTVAGDSYVLNDVFYINQPDPNGRGQLVKRGSELHGPRDPMIIPARSVLFIENMRDDSEVVAGIKAIKSGQGGPVPAPPASIAPAATPAASTRPSPSR